MSRLISIADIAVTGNSNNISEGEEPARLRLDDKQFQLERDRALIGVMFYTFARIGAVLQMSVRDYFSQGRRSWVRLHEKGGKEHEAPCVVKLATYIDEYIAAAGIAEDKDGPLFRTTGRATGIRHRMGQSYAYRVIQRRAQQAGIETQVGNHSLRATGITAYLQHEVTL